MRKTIAWAPLCALLGLAVANPAAAQSQQQPQPLLASSKSNWTSEITRRPLTLGAGMFEITAPVNFDVSVGAGWKPVTINPSLYIGITDHWQIGVRHAVGICIGGISNGCPHIYNDISFDTLVSLGRAAGFDIALGGALNVAPIYNPQAWSGEARIVGRLGGGPIALTLAPTINFGFNDRDTRGRFVYYPINLSTYNLYTPQTNPDNRESVVLPGTLQLQLGPALAAFGTAAWVAPIDPKVGSIKSFYQIPLSAGAVLTPIRWLDIGGAFTWPRFAGNQENRQLRAVTFFAAFRI